MFIDFEGKYVKIEGHYATIGKYEPSKLKFNSARNILENLASDERAIFFIRHSNRNPDEYAQFDPLNEEGVANAIQVGKDISKYIMAEEIYYGATTTKRTCQTAFYISQNVSPGMFTDWMHIATAYKFGDKQENIDGELEYINGDIFTPISGYENVLADAKARGLDANAEQVLSAAIRHTGKFKKKLSILVTHDSYVVPFIAYASGKKNTDTYNIEIDYSDGRWVNFMSGVVAVLDSDDILRGVYPLKCLNSGLIIA